MRNKKKETSKKRNPSQHEGRDFWPRQWVAAALVVTGSTCEHRPGLPGVERSTPRKTKKTLFARPPNARTYVAKGFCDATCAKRGHVLTFFSLSLGNDARAPSLMVARWSHDQSCWCRCWQPFSARNVERAPTGLSLKARTRLRDVFFPRPCFCHC